MAQDQVNLKRGDTNTGGSDGLVVMSGDAATVVVSTTQVMPSGFAASSTTSGLHSGYVLTYRACPPGQTPFSSIGEGTGSCKRCFSSREICQTGFGSAPCPAGSVCDGSTASPCPARRYCSGGPDPTQLDCPSGSYCPQGSSAPTPCPSGSYCRAFVASPVVCTAGFYCPAGASEVTVCPPDSHCPEGASAPMDCPAGHFCPERTASPSKCPKDSYCPARSTGALPCPPGTTSETGAAVCLPPPDTTPSSRSSSSSPSSSKLFLVGGLAAGGAFLIAGLCYFVKRKRTPTNSYMEMHDGDHGFGTDGPLLVSS